MSQSAAAADPRGSLKEYSVVYTDRAVNLMSSPFQEVMRDISSMLKKAYSADHTILIPGSGTYAMEAAARHFGTGKKCMVLRNGYFSYRWSDIFQACSIPESEEVLMARPVESCDNPGFVPAPLEEVLEKIKAGRPAAVFAPHVETSTGILLSDEYIKTVSAAVHEVGGVFVLDCIASGNVWINMKELGVDVLISAPQKGWSGPACVGMVMLNERAKEVLQESKVTSFVCNLQKWLAVMEKYEAGGFMYYTTLPTDSLTTFRNVMKELEQVGFEKAEELTHELGKRIRAVLEKKGYKSVAAPGYKAPTVVVSFADKATMVADFKAKGIQIAGGVPFMCNEPKGLQTFRIGLFGLDKIKNIDTTVQTFEEALNSM